VLLSTSAEKLSFPVGWSRFTDLGGGTP